MKTALFFLLDDYADWEAAHLSSILNQDPNWVIKTTSIQNEVKSIGGFTTKVDFLLDELPSTVDLFVMIGGNSWEIENKQVYSIVERYLVGPIVVGAICGAVDYLSRNGFLNDYKHTGNSKYLWNEFSQYTNETNFIEQQAIRDKNLITANGTAPIEFTELILHAINFDTAENIEKAIYMKQHGYYKYCEKYGNPF